MRGWVAGIALAAASLPPSQSSAALAPDLEQICLLFHRGTGERLPIAAERMRVTYLFAVNDDAEVLERVRRQGPYGAGPPRILRGLETDDDAYEALMSEIMDERGVLTLDGPHYVRVRPDEMILPRDAVAKACALAPKGIRLMIIGFETEDAIRRNG